MHETWGSHNNAYEDFYSCKNLENLLNPTTT